MKTRKVCDILWQMGWGKNISLIVIQGGAEILAEFLTLKLNILTATKIYEIWRLFSIFSLVFENKFFFEKSLV